MGDGYTPVTLELPFDTSQSVTLYRMSSLPITNNLLADNVKIEKIELPSAVVDHRRLTLNTASGADVRGLPPASSFLYVFEGTSSLVTQGRNAGAEKIFR